MEASSDEQLLFQLLRAYGDTLQAFCLLAVVEPHLPQRFHHLNPSSSVHWPASPTPQFVHFLHTLRQPLRSRLGSDHLPTSSYKPLGHATVTPPNFHYDTHCKLAQLLNLDFVVNFLNFPV